MKTLTELSKAVYDAMNQPAELSKLYIEISAMYSFYSDQMKEIQILKPKEWLDIKESGDEKDISDSKADKLYALRDNGKKEIELRYTLKALEKLMGAIKLSSYLNNQEFKNQI